MSFPFIWIRISLGNDNVAYFWLQARPLFDEKDIASLQDARMPGIIPREDFLNLVHVAFLCVHQNGSSDRPEMQTVVHRLTSINVRASVTQNINSVFQESVMTLGVPQLLDHSSEGDTSGTHDSSGSLNKDNIAVRPSIGYRGRD